MSDFGGDAGLGRRTNNEIGVSDTPNSSDRPVPAISGKFEINCPVEAV